MTIQSQLDQVLADMQGTADEARELIKEAEKRWYYVRSPSEESATLAGQIALGNERLNLLGRWIDKITSIRAAVGGEAVAWQFRSKLLTGAGWSDWSECSAGDADYYSRKGDAVQVRPLYASPPATVDVGAFRQLIEDESNAELFEEGVEADMPAGTTLSGAYMLGRKDVLSVLADELAALIGKVA